LFIVINDNIHLNGSRVDLTLLAMHHKFLPIIIYLKI
jgi:hypothetical protein